MENIKTLWSYILKMWPLALIVIMMCCQTITGRHYWSLFSISTAFCLLSFINRNEQKEVKKFMRHQAWQSLPSYDFQIINLKDYMNNVLSKEPKTKIALYDYKASDELKELNSDEARINYITDSFKEMLFKQESMDRDAKTSELEINNAITHSLITIGTILSFGAFELIIFKISTPNISVVFWLLVFIYSLCSMLFSAFSYNSIMVKRLFIVPWVIPPLIELVSYI